MKVLLADPLGDAAERSLGSIGAVCTQFDSSTDSLPQAVVGHDVLVVRSTPVDESVIAAGNQLGLVVRAGAGTDTIDTDAAARRGVFVCNVPGRNAIAVAELAMGLLLALDRSLVDSTVDLRSGHWDKERYRTADGVAGKTLAIVGLGSIGLELAQRARAFDMIVTAQRKADRSPDVERAIRAHGIRLVDSQAELLGSADVVSIHVPGGDATDGLVDSSFLELLKDRAIFINTSRGSTIDEAALLAAIDRKRLRVGLDVFPDEPSAASGRFDSALARHPSVIGSHHIGASTAQAQRSIVDGTVEVIEAYRSGKLLHCVNLQRAGLPAANLIVRHIDQVGVLAEVLAVLRNNKLNVQEMNNRVFVGASAAVASIELSEIPDSSAVAAITAIEAVVGVQVQELA